MFFNTINTIKTKNTVSGFNWVVVGDTTQIARSMDGSNWTAATSKGGLTGSGSGVAYGKDGAGDGLWVAVSTTGSIIAKSKDGDNWTKADSSGGLTAGYSVAYGQNGAGAGLWVAVGLGGIIAKSSDGNIWTPAGSKSGITAAYRVAYGKDGTGAGLWVAGGDGTTPLLKSTDGNTWTAVSNNNSFGGFTSGGSNQVRDLVYGKDDLGVGLWVAVGGGLPTVAVISKSYDGNIWTSSTTSSVIVFGTAVGYGKDGLGAGLWWGGGQNGINCKSPDGNTWTTVSPSVPGIPNYPGKIVYSGL
jgi:hypothetical protein